MLYLLIEQQSAELIGVRKTLHFLNEQARRRRINLRQISEPEEIPLPDSSGERNALFLLGLSAEWAKNAINQSVSRGTFPILLSNLCPQEINVPCGLVAQDVVAAMRQSVEYLRGIGCKRLALYGVNAVSTGDQWRMRCFLDMGFPFENVFVLQDTFAETYRTFSLRAEEFDGVICVYDHTAISLLRHLRMNAPEQLSRLGIMSFGDTKISGMITPSLTTISHSRREIANGAYLLYDLFLQCPSISAINVLLKSRLYIRQTTNLFSVNSPVKHGSNLFGITPSFEQNETQEIERIEKMIVQCDETDHRIIECLLENSSLKTICEQCYLSETPVKRRLRILQQRCGLQKRSELIVLLKKYFLY